MRMINELMTRLNMTKYRLAKNSGIPYSTINDICNGRARLEKCSAETIYRIAKELGVSMESLIEPCLEKRMDFELYKSDICHRLKELGDVEFIIETLEQDKISRFYKRQWYRECFYLLAMLDYVSRENNVPLCTQYDAMRSMKLENIVFPASILAVAQVTQSDEIKERAIKESIPEFIRFNIVESEVRNVI